MSLKHEYMNGSVVGLGHVSKLEMLEWLAEEDVDSLGAAFSFLSKPELVVKVWPHLENHEVIPRLLAYAGLCLRLDLEHHRWADSPAQAAKRVVAHYRLLYRKHSDHEELETIEAWIKQTYLQGDHRVKRCVVEGLLEPLFAEPGAKRRFRAWAEQERLQPAFKEASDFQP
jgi:hypothetical protein